MNGRGNALGRLQNSSGSLLSKVGLVVGIPDLSPTDLRRSVESIIQASADMKNNNKALNMHSDHVGKQIYDKSKFVVRPEFINHVEHIESSSGESSKRIKLSNFDKAGEDRMNEMELEDAVMRRSHAQKFLTEEKRMRAKNLPLGPRCRVNALDRSFLQTLVHEKVFMSAENPQFPRGK